MDRELELRERISEKVDQFNLKKARVRKEIQERVTDLVEAEMYDDWLEIHKDIRDALDSKTVKAGDMRVITRAYTNPGRYEYWRDYRERPNVAALPKTKRATPKEATPSEPEMTVKDINRRHRDDNGRDYEVTYEGKTYLMSVREPDGLFVPEAKVSNNYDRVSNGGYASMYEEMPRKDHEEFLKKVKEALVNAGLW